MYNLTVEKAHTFFVGKLQWLVHNICSSPSQTRSPIFADNDLLVHASEKGHVNALAEIRSGTTYITPNQYNEFLNVSTSARKKTRLNFLNQENIKVFDGNQARSIVSSNDFQTTFKRVSAIQGRGDGALAAFSKATGFEAVTMERKLFKMLTSTYPQ